MDTNRRRPVSITHSCAAHGCDLQIFDGRLMCRRHWGMVPAELRRRVWRTYRPGQEKDGDMAPEYRAAAKAAVAAVARAENAVQT